MKETLTTLLLSRVNALRRRPTRISIREDAARIGQEIITVSEASILQDCELPKAAELPPVAMSKTGQLTLFSDTDPQPTLF